MIFNIKENNLILLGSQFEQGILILSVPNGNWTGGLSDMGWYQKPGLEGLKLKSTGLGFVFKDSQGKLYRFEGGANMFFVKINDKLVADPTHKDFYQLSSWVDKVNDFLYCFEYEKRR